MCSPPLCARAVAWLFSHTLYSHSRASVDMSISPTSSERASAGSAPETAAVVPEVAQEMLQRLTAQPPLQPVPAPAPCTAVPGRPVPGDPTAPAQTECMWLLDDLAEQKHATKTNTRLRDLALHGRHFHVHQTWTRQRMAPIGPYVRCTACDGYQCDVRGAACTACSGRGYRLPVRTVQICEWCAKTEPPKSCPRCLEMKYCDVACQRLHWSMHKHMCEPLCVRSI